MQRMGLIPLIVAGGLLKYRPISKLYAAERQVRSLSRTSYGVRNQDEHCKEQDIVETVD